ncbi:MULTISPECIES: hypothetical protein [Glutamicibacter]|jgi:hypothetical protein|uniref:Cation-transporting ATPase n=1 Tax=Glutamicibacter arilaitensis TaxID=256701 RepID=A0A4Y8TWM6_9MICC|nr:MULTISPECIES: hypothetical protein [Glutamicibacter]TFH56092.1 hypothetical protein EXY26_03250 [Glutamicibacter arilaitensis]HCJ55652.1 hypothetical protein [Glutamicibacter sp.]
MSMFDKLLRKGKQMAGEYVREQLNQRSSNSNQRGYGNSQRGYQQNPGGYQQPQQQNYGDRGYGNAQASGVSREDQAAIEKYRYMLRTAPPQDMERAHAEAFARLTPQQRELLHRELSEQLPPAERPMTQDPRDLARSATRAEMSRPGFMDKLLGSGGGRRGMGMAAGAAGGLGVGLLGGVAGAFIGTAIAGPLLDGFAGIGEEFGSMADGLGETVAGAGEQISAAGEGFGDQAGGAFGDFLGGGGGGDFGDFEF